MPSMSIPQLPESALLVFRMTSKEHFMVIFLKESEKLETKEKKPV
jgi:hypothetical protein